MSEYANIMHQSRSRLSIVPVLLFCDALCIYLSLFLAYWLRFFSPLTEVFPVTKGLPAWDFYHQIFLFALIFLQFIFFKYGFYRVYFLPLLDDIIRIVKAVTIGIFFMLFATFFYRDFSFSRLTFGLFWVVLILFLISYREVLKLATKYYLRSFIKKDSTLVIGTENGMLRSVLKQHPHIQVFYQPSGEESDFERVKRTVVEKSISQIIFTRHNWTQSRLLEMYDWCESLGVNLKFVPDIVQLYRGEVCVDSSLCIPIFHLKPTSLTGFDFYFKRIFDLFIASLIMSFLWPILLITAILIKLDSAGPFFYFHKRVGYRGQSFNFFKFRTMVLNADELLEKLKAESERKGPVFKMANDPRITKIGRFLRRYSIDELPQLINVLRGEMSLVGPRPQVLWEAASYDEWAKRRLRVRPGITGLWQVSGRASLSYEEMVELDIFYIENWSLGLDLKILARTVPAIFSKQGAY